MGDLVFKFTGNLLRGGGWGGALFLNQNSLSFGHISRGGILNIKWIITFVSPPRINLAFESLQMGLS